MTISPEAIECRARKICWEAGIDPDFMAYEGQDDLGYAIREPNWTRWTEQAEDELLAEASPSSGPIPHGKRDGGGL